MLRSAKELKGYSIGATEGEIGKVSDFYFDDRFWTVRYLVADTGGWLTGRMVLVSPYALDAVDVENKVIHARMTKAQIEGSPSLETDKPVSRQYEESYHGYYGWPGYWEGPYAWGAYYSPPREFQMPSDDPSGADHWDANLRSVEEVTGYNIEARDGDIGHVVDFLIDDETWTIRYAVIETGNWWAGKEVLMPPRMLDDIRWADRKVTVNLSRENIKQAPEYDKEIAVTRDYETRLHGHYNREGYWYNEYPKTTHQMR